MNTSLITILSILGSIAVVLSFLLRRWNTIRQFATRSPKLSIYCQLESLQHASAAGLPLWIKNESSITHTLARFTIQIKELPNSPVRVVFPNRKYLLPLELAPDEPEKKFHIMADFSAPPPNDGLTRTLVIKGFCRWKGEEVEAGSCEVDLISQ